MKHSCSLKQCKHESVKYCKPCGNVYCEECNEQWETHCMQQHYPNWIYATPPIQPITWYTNNTDYIKPTSFSNTYSV